MPPPPSHLYKSPLLILGDADFSFPLALSTLHPSLQITATSYDTHTILQQKYKTLERNTLKLKLHTNVKCIHAIDATKLHTYKYFKNDGDTYKTVIFNFPHVGKGIKSQEHNIKANQTLIQAVFVSVRRMFVKPQQEQKKEPPSQGSVYSMYTNNRPKDGGSGSKSTGTKAARDSMKVKPSNNNMDHQDITFHITLKSYHPYTEWDIKSLAKLSGWKLLTSYAFDPSHFPGYTHRRTLGAQEGVTGDANEEIAKGARCYIFQIDYTPEEMRCLNLQKAAASPSKSRRTRSESSDESDNDNAKQTTRKKKAKH